MISVDNVQLEKIEIEKSKKICYKLEGLVLLAEEAAVKIYSQKGFQAIWSENQFWWVILSLLFWDVIFAKVKGAVSFSNGNETIFPEPKDRKFNVLFDQFVSMNGMPSDLFTPEFYDRRKILVEDHSSYLKSNNIIDFFQKSYHTNNGKNCRLVEDWKRYSLNELLVPFKTCEPSQILGILDRILSNIKEFRSGLPDLIVYNKNYLFFSEIKSDNDKLRPNQIEWHKYLSDRLYFDIEILLINHDKSQKEKVLNCYNEPDERSDKSKSTQKTEKILPEPSGKVIDAFRSQVINIKKNNQIDQYFDFLNQIRELRSQKKFDQMLDLCKRSLPLIESVIEWDEEFSKRKWNGSNGLTMPAIESACDYLPIFKRTNELVIYEQFINEMPKLQYYKIRVENAFLMLEIVQKLESLLKDNDYVLQKDLKKLLGIQDGRTISRVVKYLENTSQISRSKVEKTYKLRQFSQPQEIHSPKTNSKTPKEKKSFFQKLFGV